MLWALDMKGVIEFCLTSLTFFRLLGSQTTMVSSPALAPPSCQGRDGISALFPAIMNHVGSRGFLDDSTWHWHAWFLADGV